MPYLRNLVFCTCPIFNSIDMGSLDYLALNLTTPSLLFSATTLVLLAYTNRFLAYAQVVRNLHEKHEGKPSSASELQIANLYKRLKLTRLMQLMGIASMLLCVLSMFLIYISLQLMAAIIFGLAMLLLVASLAVCIWEIQISVDALELHLKSLKEDREEHTEVRNSNRRNQNSLSE